MEAELERLLKEKEQSTPMEFIPMSVVPLVGVWTTTISTTNTTEIPSTSPLTVLEKTIELEKSM